MVAIVVVLIVAIGAFVPLSDDTDQSSVGTTVSDSNQVEEMSQNNAMETTTLEAVGNCTDSGTATKSL